MIIKNTNHEAQFDWGNVYVQGGTGGIVFTNIGSYRTAFVEAFPQHPKTFIRGEGTTIEEAEKSAWEQYQIVSKCDEHEFERRGYKNGAAFCKKCGMFQINVFEPTEKCIVCDCNTYYTSDMDGNFYCENHKNDIPEEKMWDIQKRARKLRGDK